MNHEFRPEDLVPDDLADELRELIVQFARQNARRCAYLRSHRVSDAPLRRGWLGDMLGLASSGPRLARTASKFGGEPYVESPDDVPAGHTFVGQLNFADLVDRPDGLPTSGLLALYAATDDAPSPFRALWYSSPLEHRAVDARVDCLARYETRLELEPGWSIPELPSALTHFEDQTLDAWFQLLEQLVGPGHQLGGHPSAGLGDHYGFEALEGASTAIEDYEMILRLDADTAADFHWGSNVVYLIIERSDFAAGRWHRIIAIGANV